MRQCWAGLLLVFVSAVAVSRAQVQQEPSAETREGTGIGITCSRTNIQSYIYWYRQFPGQGLAFIASAFQGAKEVVEPAGRLSVSADRRSSTLWLSRPRLTDAAVALYFCTLLGPQ
uniref:Immunoglobulin V-set domain-containing protein n=1 Tax=Coturnix japonica TaxID=93934 RepID=A0A8C2YG37_COTJA